MFADREMVALMGRSIIRAVRPHLGAPVTIDLTRASRDPVLPPQAKWPSMRARFRKFWAI